MLKRYFLMFFWLFLLLIVYLVSLLPLLMIKGQLDEPTAVMAFCLWGVLVVLSFIPLLGKLIHKVWLFEGIGEPVSPGQLRERLLSINAAPGPVRVISKRQKLIVTWRYQEVLWCELFSRLGISRVYELHCRLDPVTRTVFLADRIRSADFLICPERVKIGFLRIPLPVFRVRPRQLGSIAQYATKEPHEYDLHPREIKSPVMGTILASGWNVRFSLF
jgi:hypothetical protein